MTPNRIVLCMKWGRLFNANYVNVLYSACRRHIRGDFRFVCLTDDPSGLAPEVETMAIPDIGLTEQQIQLPGVWRKLALFHRDVAALSPGARALFIDLDMMVLGDLDPFFAADGSIVLLDTGHDWRAREAVQPSTGIFAFTLGEQLQILQAFQADPAGAIDRFRNEQDFVTAHASGVSLWRTGTVISFKRHLVRRFGGDLFLSPRKPPSGPAVLAFHGDPRPSDLLRSGIWGHFPHVGRGPVTWMQAYWQRPNETA